MTNFQTKKAPHALKGEVTIPGDKSISHRAIMLSAIAEGETRIHGLLEGEDVMATVAAFQAMGVIIEKHGDIWHVHGVGLKGLKKPNDDLDMGNSGTSARLIMGILAGQDFETTITGDESLCKRPMKRVTDPLSVMGASFEFSSENNDCLPIKIKGRGYLKAYIPLRPIVASAQVKSAILLATLYTAEDTMLQEEKKTRDHTEIMMQQFGVNVESKKIKDSDKNLISMKGRQYLKSPRDIYVPSDPSSASFFAAAALMIPDSKITMKNICMNPTRTGFIRALKDIMEGNIELKNKQEHGDNIADLTINYSQLKNINNVAQVILFIGNFASNMIDEYPIFFALSASIPASNSIDIYEAQKGDFFTIANELRIKESNRMDAMKEGLEACGVKVESGNDWMIVHGTGKVKGGARVKTYMDHRIAMSFIILGLIAENPIVLDDVSPIMTSFPTFFTELKKLGVDFGL